MHDALHLLRRDIGLWQACNVIALTDRENIRDAAAKLVDSQNGQHRAIIESDTSQPSSKGLGFGSSLYYRISRILLIRLCQVFQLLLANQSLLDCFAHFQPLRTCD